MKVYNSPEQDELFWEIRVERQRQEMLWKGRNNTNPKWLAILMEEVGELANAMLEDDFENINVEMVQVAAVCAAWREQLIKENKNKNDKPTEV